MFAFLDPTSLVTTSGYLGTSTGPSPGTTATTVRASSLAGCCPWSATSRLFPRPWPRCLFSASAADRSRQPRLGRGHGPHWLRGRQWLAVGHARLSDAGYLLGPLAAFLVHRYRPDKTAGISRELREQHD